MHTESRDFNVTSYKCFLFVQYQAKRRRSTNNNVHSLHRPALLEPLCPRGNSYLEKETYCFQHHTPLKILLKGGKVEDGNEGAKRFTEFLTQGSWGCWGNAPDFVHHLASLPLYPVSNAVVAGPLQGRGDESTLGCHNPLLHGLSSAEVINLWLTQGSIQPSVCKQNSSKDSSY